MHKNHSLIVFLGVAACQPVDPLDSSSVSEGCRLERDGTTWGSLAPVCARVAERWQLLAEDTLVPGEIRLADIVGFRSINSPNGWTVYWERPAPGKELHSHTVYDVIAHEAGHELLFSYAPELTGSYAGHRYGSRAPDWFDEAPAIWMESDSFRQGRLRTVRGATPSLGTLLTMRHPAMHDVIRNATRGEFQVIKREIRPPCAPCTWLHDTLRTKHEVTSVRLFPDGRTDTVTNYTDGHPDNLTSIEELQYYPLVYSILLFIHTRGGSAAFRELLNRYRADPTPRADVLNGLPGLPASFDAVEREWHAFLRALE